MGLVGATQVANKRSRSSAIRDDGEKDSGHPRAVVCLASKLSRLASLLQAHRGIKPYCQAVSGQAVRFQFLAQRAAINAEHRCGSAYIAVAML
jgi:hypothetical protein